MPDPESIQFVGVGTPQANPTVELEFREFLRGPVCTQATRLTSRAGSPMDRLVEYFEQIPRALDSYDTLELAAFGFACTGSSYLVGAEAEADLVASEEAKRGFPIVTATAAIREELRLRQAARIAVLAPYPAALCEAAVGYWEQDGIAVIADARIDIGEDTRGIYALTDQEVAAAVESFDAADADVLLLSGTGMPTIAALRDGPLPTISSNFCLAAEILRRIGRLPQDLPAEVADFPIET